METALKGSQKQQVGLIILNRDNFYIYTPQIAGFLTLQFPERTVKNMEIQNQQDLENLISQLVETSKVAPAELTLILSTDILFEKEIAGGPEESKNRKKFLDSLPFESVYKVSIPKDQKPYLVTVNREFVDGVIRGFTNLGFTVDRALPYEFLKKISVQNVDVNNALDIIKKSENLKLYNMLDYPQKKIENSTSIIQAGKDDGGGSKVRLYVLLGVLGACLLILVFLLVRK